MLWFDSEMSATGLFFEYLVLQLLCYFALVSTQQKLVEPLGVSTLQVEIHD